MTDRTPSASGRGLRAQIVSGTTVRGLFLDIADFALVETVGGLGLDFACLDLEHGSMSDDAVSAACLAASSFQLPLLARLRKDDMARAARFLDAGGSGIVVAHIEARAEVDTVCDAVLLPPRGRRGVGATRATSHGRVRTTQTWAEQENEQFVLGVQIEDKRGLEHVAEIVAHDAVAFVLPGTRDLALDLGGPDESGETRLRGALQAISDAAVGQCAVATVVRDLDASGVGGASVLLVALGSMLRHAANRFREIR